MGFNVLDLGHQVHRLKRNHFACRRRNLPSLPGTRLMDFHREACSALLQTFNSWLNFTYARLRYLVLDGDI